MKEILEIRFHGRGGQGVKTAADLLALTFLEENKYIQSFPEYGPERSGAPIKAFLRISSEPITIHCGITEPDIVVVLDASLLETINITEGLEKNKIIIINTPYTPTEIAEKFNLKEYKVYTVDATKIALDEIGVPFPNTPMLGAVIRVIGIVSLDDLKKHFLTKFGKKLVSEKLEGNIRAIERAYNELK